MIPSQAYLYVIVVDGILRYVGKGRGARLFVHVIEAKRSAVRCGRRTAHLRPQLHRKLVEAIRAGSSIAERVILSGLSDAEAYRLESNLILHFHKFFPDLLWNTVDERFVDRSVLPTEWNNPEHPLYRVTRPLQPQSAANTAK